MSKKIAAGAQAILLDVKAGNGAFMETVSQARELAHLMVSIGELSGRDVMAVLSDMNQPLGVEVGNALEMKEAIKTLKGEGPDDFVAHCLEIASLMVLLGKKADSKSEARKMVTEALETGKGFEYLEKLIEAQGGDVSFIAHPEKLPQAPIKESITASKGGYISQVHARTVGETAVVLGAGRTKKGEAINPAVGISVLVKVGQQVEKGQELFILHARNQAMAMTAKKDLLKAIKIVPAPVDPLPLFYGLVD
jgi:pyrimidine-nucleoside phosphorylase